LSSLLCLLLLDREALLGRLHGIELLAELGQTRLQLVHGVIQGLDLTRELIHFSRRIILDLGHGRLHRGHGIAYLVDRVGILFDQVIHNAHTLVERLLHARHLVLQGLHLNLELHNFFADAPGGRHAYH
jgi:hypothetical protein